MEKAYSKRWSKRAAKFVIHGACVAVKISTELFAWGILKDNDCPLDDQTGAATVLLDGEADLRYFAPVRLHSIHFCSICHISGTTPHVSEFCGAECVLGASAATLADPTRAALLSIVSLLHGIVTN